MDELIRQASSKLQSQMTYYENELIEALVAIEFVDDDDEDAIVEINIKANNARYNIERMYRNNGQIGGIILMQLFLSATKRQIK